MAHLWFCDTEDITQCLASLQGPQCTVQKPLTGMYVQPSEMGHHCPSVHQGQKQVTSLLGLEATRTGPATVDTFSIHQ